MSVDSSWNLRAENDCLFVDDVSLGKVVLQHNTRPGMLPYIHPLWIGGGKICITEDSPSHHPRIGPTQPSASPRYITTTLDSRSGVAACGW